MNRPRPRNRWLTSLLIAAATCCAISQASEHGAAQSGDQPRPRDVFVGEHWLHIAAENVRGDPPTRYRVLVKGALYGANQGDALRLEWKKGRRTLATTRCPVRYRNAFDCKIEGDKLTKTGEHRLIATLIDQNTDAEIPVLDAKPVIESARTMGYHQDGSYHFPAFYVNQDERMGLAYVTNPTDGVLRFFFWRSEETDESRHPQINFRCRKAEDAPWQGFTAQRMISDPRNARNTLRQLVHVRVHDGSGRNEERQTRLWWREMVDVQFPAKVSFRGEPLDEHVEEATWTCQYREDGVAVRTFWLFVSEEGRLFSPEAQRGRDGLPFAIHNFRVLNVGFPEEATYGESFDGPAMKRSFGYGRPWPKDGAGLEGMLERIPRVRRDFEFPRIPPGVRDGDRVFGRRRR